MRRSKFTLGFDSMEARVVLSTVTPGATATVAQYSSPTPTNARTADSPSSGSDDFGGMDFSGNTYPSSYPLYSEPIAYGDYQP